MERTILILEDEAVIAMDIALELSDAGWSVLGPAGTVEKARSLLRSGIPDAALLDVNLKGGKSFELALELRDGGVGVVFLTGYTAASIPEDLADIPVVSKPVQMQALRQALSRAFAAR